MDEKRGKFGIGEILFGLVIILGIVGTVSFFAFEETLGEYQTTFMIASSLAFIGSFFALSVYARAKKRSHLRRISPDRAIASWIEYIGFAESTGGGTASLPAGTLESIAMHAFTADGFRLAPSTSKKADGLIRFLDKDEKVGLVQTWQGQQPLGMRELVAFYEIFRAEKAAWGEIWAPVGFSPEAVKWVSKKSITLVDAVAIQEVVENLIARQRDAVSSAGK
jgi:hypothetical protein